MTGSGSQPHALVGGKINDPHFGLAGLGGREVCNQTAVIGKLGLVYIFRYDVRELF